MPDLHETLDEVWQRLGRGVADPRHAWHWPVICTVAGDEAQGRVVVLRGVDRSTRTLWFHTDRRSAKVGQLAGLGWVLYDPRARLQLRVSGASVLADPATTDREWARLPARSRGTYRVDPAPGTPLGATWSSPHAGDDGREHFAVIVTEADRLETLRLGRQGHERAVFAWDEGWTGTWTGTWVVP